MGKPCRFVNSGRYPSEKKIVKSSCRTCRPAPVKIEEKKMKKKKHTSFLKYRRKKQICARYIRGFLFIRKNSCSRLRFGNSFRYSKQKEEKISSKSKKIRKKYQFSAPPVYETSCFR